MVAVEEVQASLTALLKLPDVAVSLKFNEKGGGVQLSIMLEGPLSRDLMQYLQRDADDKEHLCVGRKRKSDEIDMSDSDDCGQDENDADEKDSGESSNAIILSEKEKTLLAMYKRTSGRQLFKQRPDVWTSHGKWKREYKYLDGIYEKEKRGASGSNGRVTNRPFSTFFELNSKTIQAGLVCQDDNKRIILSFTRASSAPPTYGAQGMFDRGATAAKAWAKLEGPATIISIPRARVASKWPLRDGKAVVGEMISVLNAAPDGTVVELLSVGIDGLTTDVESLSWIQNTWGTRLLISFVVAVPIGFPGTAETFRLYPNSIRYAKVSLQDLHTTSQQPECSIREQETEILTILRRIRSFKDNKESGQGPLTLLTSGRANFRVCPDSTFESGVDEDARQSRRLR